MKYSLASDPTTAQGNVLAQPRPPVASLNTGTLNRKPWVVATGTQGTRSRKAAQYLRVFDYKEAARYELDTPILAKVVCNLRNYYQQDTHQTVELITALFNPKSWQVWSKEAITLAWELVEGFTPSLGLADAKAIAKQRAAMIEYEVVDLIAWTRQGDRVDREDLILKA